MKREPLTKEPDQPFIAVSPERKSYDEIIDRNDADELTEDEAAELEILGELEHVMQLVKVRAREYVKTKT
jgi:hypothetical protein